MLLRGGRRVALVEGAVVAVDVEGDGVEAGGEEDTVVAVVAVVAGTGPDEGWDDSVNKDMFATGPKDEFNGIRGIQSSRREIVWEIKVAMEMLLSVFCEFDPSRREVDAQRSGRQGEVRVLKMTG